jgi:glyoxylase I family protein
MRIHHLAMRTRDVAALAHFYTAHVGLTVVRRHEGTGEAGGTRAIWLAAGDAVVMIEHAREAEPTVPERTMELVAFALPAEERAHRKIALAAAGIPLEGETAHTLYIRDPDGRRVGLSDYPLDAVTAPPPR